MQRFILAITLSLGLFAAVPSNAIVVFGFEINSASSDPLFIANAGDTNTISDDTLNASSSLDLTITLDGVAVPNSNGFQGAQFTYDATLTGVQQQGDFLIASYGGTFSFDEANNGPNILSATFTDMTLVYYAPGGSVVFPIGLSAATTGTPVILTAGPSLAAHLPVNNVLKGQQTSNFTVDELEADDIAGLYDGEQEIIPAGNFTFRSSFSATSQVLRGGDIPEPATFGIALLGGALLMTRRRSAKA